ncbi:cellulase family glycosylhydrolase [Paraburkholderia caffeinilytica]|uniref:cellulase family glycosylhydrolase n=1 Tax=Paraburkholderia caffeinilytica TaxID=1761016 RepID=UPI003DA01E88
MISFKNLLKTGVIVIALCMVGITMKAQAQQFGQRVFDSEGPLNVGTQVKVERFTSTSAMQIKAAGFGFVRFGVWVNSMQTAEYRKRVAGAFAAAEKAGLPVLLTVRSTIPLAQSSQSDEAARNAQLRDAAQQLIHVVNDLVGTYRNNVLAIELWNEPELPAYWPTGDVETTFPVYMRMVCAGLKNVHAWKPVIGFGFARAPASGSRSDKLLQSLQSSSDHCIDAVSYHAYGMSERQIQDASAYVLSRYGLPALITEWGVSSGAKGGMTGQAANIQAFLMKRASMKTPLISIYEWQDTANGKNARERNFGLVDASGTPKPALGATLEALRK